MPQISGFSPICDPKRSFFKNRALSLLYPYGALTSCKKIEKTNERSLRCLKTDGPRTNGRTRAITKDPLGRNRGPKLEKSLEPSLEIFKDRRTDIGDYIGPPRVNPGSKITNLHSYVTKYLQLKL